MFFTGHYGKIKSIKLKHKSKIIGKENSRTEFYYEIVLENNFEFNKKFSVKLDTTTLFGKKDKRYNHLLKKFLPVISFIDKVELNLSKS